MKAIEVLMEHGVPEDRIIFINLVSSVLLIRSTKHLYLYQLRSLLRRDLLRSARSIRWSAW